MKRILLGFFLALSVYLFFSPPCEGALPGSALEFEKRYRVEGSTPEGAAKLFFDAVFAYMDRNTRAEGTKMLTLAMNEKPGWDRRHTMKLFVDRRWIYGKHIFVEEMATLSGADLAVMKMPSRGPRRKTDDSRLGWTFPCLNRD